MSRSTTTARATSSRRSATTTRATSSRRSSWSTPPRNAAPTPSSCRSATNRALYTREFYDQPYDNENSFGADLRRASRGARAVGRASYAELQAHAREIGITFFATAFDFESADFLAELDVPAFKFASGDLRNTPLLRHVAAFGKPMMLSHRRRGRWRTSSARSRRSCRSTTQLCVLQCTAAYPADAEDLNLQRDHDAARAVPGARDRALRSPERHRDGARRLHARRARDREALHAQSRREGHRPRLLARCRRECGSSSATCSAFRARSATASSVRSPIEEAPIRKMGKKLVAARELEEGHVLTRRGRRDQVAGRRRPAAVRARPDRRPATAPAAGAGRERRARRPRAGRGTGRGARSSAAVTELAPLLERVRLRGLRLRRRVHRQPRLGERAR